MFPSHDLRQYPDMALYQEILLLKYKPKGVKWVVENVMPYYKPLIAPTKKLGRHLFWSNFPIVAPSIKSPAEFIKTGSVEASEALKEWLGINYEGNIYYNNNHCPSQVLRNCVHPVIGEHILKSATHQDDLFTAVRGQ